jgi:hypothetical protein
MPDELSDGIAALLRLLEAVEQDRDEHHTSTRQPVASLPDETNCELPNLAASQQPVSNHFAERITAAMVLFHNQSRSKA